MRRLLRTLSLVVALFSFESTVLAAREPCTMGTEMERESGDVDCAHGPTESSGRQGDHSPARGHPGPACVVAAACSSAALPVSGTPVPSVIAVAIAVPSAVRTLAPGRRPAPDVPPPRA